MENIPDKSACKSYSSFLSVTLVCQTANTFDASKSRDFQQILCVGYRQGGVAPATRPELLVMPLNEGQAQRGQ